MFKVAIVGQPNVGKSSLFNRIVKAQDAITSNKAGTTRDFKKRDVEIAENKEITLIDTGGLEDRDELFNKVKNKALEIAKEADLILFMADGQKYPDDTEIKYFRNLLKLKKPIWLVLNKIDNDKLKEMIYEYYELGAQKIFPISVTHNRGITKLINEIARIVPENKITEPILAPDEDLPLEELLSIQEAPKVENKEIKVSIIGKVNVGKSSLLNALVEEERSIVSDVDGTCLLYTSDAATIA
jgi:GTP-binding protein